MADMTFQQQVLQEIAEESTGSRRAALAGLAAIVLCTGNFHADSSGQYVLTLQSERHEPLIKFFTLIRKTFNISFESGLKEAGQQDPEGKTPRESFQYTVEADLAGKIAEAVFLTRQGRLMEESCVGAADPRLLTDERCVRSFLAGEFLCVGTVRDPEKEYYLSFDIASSSQAAQSIRLLQEAGLPFRLAEHGRRSVIVTRDSSVIVDTLNCMGAHNSMMDLENARIRKQFRGKINREVNCETANIQKTVTASAKQVREIRRLKESPGWDLIPASLRQIALLREQFPESSLQELGSMLDPPVGKSGVNHRLRRLSALAEELDRKDTGRQK